MVDQTDAIREDEIEDMDHPWRDEELLRELYHDHNLSLNQIADLFGCAYSTVSNWMRRHEIPTREISEAKRVRTGTHNCASYRVRDHGSTECSTTVDGTRQRILVHRLLAISEYGFDAVCDNDVHHKNGIPWDNRPSNIEVMDPGEHIAYHHTKIRGIDRLRVAEMYEHGDVSYRELHDILDFDVHWATIMAIHKEFYGGDAS